MRLQFYSGLDFSIGADVKREYPISIKKNGSAYAIFLGDDPVINLFNQPPYLDKEKRTAYYNKVSAYPALSKYMQIQQPDLDYDLNDDYNRRLKRVDFSWVEHDTIRV